MPDLVAFLVQNRVVGFLDMDAAVQRMKREGGRLATSILETTRMEPDDLAVWVSRCFGLEPALDELLREVDADLVTMWTADRARRMGALPLRLEGHRLDVGVLEPLEEMQIAELKEEFGCDVVQYQVLEFRFFELLRHFYRSPTDNRFLILASRHPLHAPRTESGLLDVPAAAGAQAASSDDERPPRRPPAEAAAPAPSREATPASSPRSAAPPANEASTPGETTRDPSPNTGTSASAPAHEGGARREVRRRSEVTAPQDPEGAEPEPGGRPSSVHLRTTGSSPTTTEVPAWQQGGAPDGDRPGQGQPEGGPASPGDELPRPSLTEDSVARKLDAAERGHRQRQQTENLPRAHRRPAAPPLPADLSGGLSWSLEELSAFFQSCTDRERLLTATLAYLKRFFHRRFLLRIGDGRVYGQAAQGIASGAVQPTNVEIPFAADSPLQAIREGMTYFHGAPEDVGLRTLYTRLHIQNAEEMIVLPIRVGGQAAMILVGDGGPGKRIDPQHLPQVSVVLNRLSLCLEQLHARARLDGAVDQGATPPKGTPTIAPPVDQGDRGLYPLPSDGWELPDQWADRRTSDDDAGRGAWGTDLEAAPMSTLTEDSGWFDLRDANRMLAQRRAAESAPTGGERTGSERTAGAGRSAGRTTPARPTADAAPRRSHTFGFSPIDLEQFGDELPERLRQPTPVSDVIAVESVMREGDRGAPAAAQPAAKQTAAEQTVTQRATSERSAADHERSVRAAALKLSQPITAIDPPEPVAADWLLDPPTRLQPAVGDRAIDLPEAAPTGTTDAFHMDHVRATADARTDAGATQGADAGATQGAGAGPDEAGAVVSDAAHGDTRAATTPTPTSEREAGHTGDADDDTIDVPPENTRPRDVAPPSPAPAPAPRSSDPARGVVDDDEHTSPSPARTEGPQTLTGRPAIRTEPGETREEHEETSTDSHAPGSSDSGSSDSGAGGDGRRRWRPRGPLTALRSSGPAAGAATARSAATTGDEPATSEAASPAMSPAMSPAPTVATTGHADAARAPVPAAIPAASGPPVSAIPRPRPPGLSAARPPAAADAGPPPPPPGPAPHEDPRGDAHDDVDTEAETIAIEAPPPPAPRQPAPPPAPAASAAARTAARMSAALGRSVAAARSSTQVLGAVSADEGFSEDEWLTSEVMETVEHVRMTGNLPAVGPPRAESSVVQLRPDLSQPAIRVQVRPPGSSPPPAPADEAPTRVLDGSETSLLIGLGELAAQQHDAREDGGPVVVSASMEALLHGDEASREGALAELIERPADQLPPLIGVFPGPLLLNRRRADEELRPIEEHGPLIRLALARIEDYREQLWICAESASPDARYYAIRLLSFIRTMEFRYPLVEATFDRDNGVRRLALQVLEQHREHAEFGHALDALRARLHHRDVHVVEAAIVGLTLLRDTGAIPVMIELLGHEDQALAERTAQALSRMTFMDFGLDISRWTLWYNVHGDEPQEAWLAEAMTSPEPSRRVLAEKALRQIPRLVVNYHAEISEKQRDRARRTVERFFGLR